MSVVKRAFSSIGWACLACLAGAQIAAAQNIVITNARIIDGTDRVIERGSVVIRDGRIVSVSAGAAAAVPGAQQVDARGMTVMPGFIEAHRHVIRGNPADWLKNESKDRMQEYLDAGFTTVLSCGDPLEEILELRKRLKDGQVRGPRLFAAGRVPLARSAGGFPAGVDPARIDNSRPPDRPTQPAGAIPEEDTRALVRKLAAAGVDAIKAVIIVTPGGPETKTLSVVADEAKKQGIPSITHAVTVQDTVAAVEAGTHILVHTPHIGQLTEAEAKMIAGSGIPMMSTLGIFVPTFAEDNANIRARTGEDNLPRFRDLDPFPMNTISSGGQGPVNARMLWEAGITYGYGTDTTFVPRDSLFQELKPLRLMFSRKDIVQIMTRNAAAVLGQHGKDLGTLEPGKLGDIVMLDGDPLADIDDLFKVKLVVKEGVIVSDKR